MSFVKCTQVDSLRSGSIMKVAVGYNDLDGYQQNHKQRAKYANIPGLPSLDTPLMVDNVMTRDNRQLGNGQAVIIPPDVYIQFEVDFGCQIGFNASIRVQPQNTDIIGKWVSFAQKEVTPQNEWQRASFRRGSDGKTIFVFDWKNYAKYNINHDVAEHSYQIKIDVCPVSSYVLPNGSTISCSPNLAPPVNSDGFGVALGDSINVHKGTVTDGKDSSEKWGHATIVGDESQIVSCVFDVLVINDKYYSTHYYDIIQNNINALDD